MFSIPPVHCMLLRKLWNPSQGDQLAPNLLAPEIAPTTHSRPEIACLTAPSCKIYCSHCQHYICPPMPISPRFRCNLRRLMRFGHTRFLSTAPWLLLLAPVFFPLHSLALGQPRYVETTPD